jgi:hypothetical protein
MPLLLLSRVSTLAVRCTVRTLAMVAAAGRPAAARTTRIANTRSGTLHMLTDDGCTAFRNGDAAAAPHRQHFYP